MQFYEHKYPRLVKKKAIEGGTAYVIDPSGANTFLMDEDLFESLYRVAGPASALRHMAPVSFDEYQLVVAAGQPTRIRDRMALVGRLVVLAVLLLFGVSDARISRVLRCLARLSAAHGTTLSKLAIHVEDTDAFY